MLLLHVLVGMKNVTRFFIRNLYGNILKHPRNNNTTFQNDISLKLLGEKANAYHTVFIAIFLHVGELLCVERTHICVPLLNENERHLQIKNF